MGVTPKPETEAETAQGSVAAVLLAAGSSRRFAAAHPKQLQTFQGETLVHRALRRALEASVGTETPVCVVLGHQADQVRAAIDDLLTASPHIVCLLNRDHAQGQSTSVRRAVEHLLPIEGVRGAYFLAIDQPWVEPSLLQRLVASHARGDAKIVVPSFGPRRGAPVLFDRMFFPELLELEGDQGGRQILHRHADQIRRLELDDDLPLRDIDTLEDLDSLPTSHPDNGSSSP